MQMYGCAHTDFVHAAHGWTTAMPAGIAFHNFTISTRVFPFRLKAIIIIFCFVFIALGIKDPEGQKLNVKNKC